MYTDYLG